MIATYTVDYKTGNAYVTLSSIPASTFHADRIKLDTEAAIAEASYRMQGTSMRYQSVAASRNNIEEDEQEWDALFSTPRVQRGLRRLAAEARRQFAVGETEEGGFAVE